MSWPLCHNLEGRAKISYPSKAKARKYAARSREATATPMFFYCCWHCGGWHITSQPRRQTQPPNHNPR